MAEDDPFEALADLEEIASEDGAADATDPAVDELFDEMDVADIDEEALWDEVAAGEAAAASTTGGTAAADGAAVEDVGTGSVVSKKSYCQKCEHFSKPPQVGCRNGGTEIVEQVDLDHFRVQNCPVVERRQSASRNIEEQ